MKAVIDTVKNIISPEQNWSKFLMKLIGVGVVAAIGFAGFQVYTGSQEKKGPDDGIEVIFEEKPEKKIKVDELLSRITSGSREVNSVWLYDWPDARNIVPVSHMPQNTQDPMPGGYWVKGDESVIGHFVLGSCTTLDRPFLNVACPIMGKEDAWGVLVVTYADGETEPDPKITKVTAMKISEILYLLENKH